MLLVLLLSFSSASLLDVATSVGKYLQSTHGKMNSTDDAPKNFPYLNTSLYYGPPGVSIYFLQLAQATNGSEWIDSARSSLDFTIKNIPKIIELYGTNIGFYYGLAGIAYSLRRFGYATKSNEHLQAAETIEKHILSIAPFSVNESAPLWNNTDIAHGVSGTGLYFLWVAKQEISDSQKFIEAARRGGAWLLTRMESTPTGARWSRGPDTDGIHENQYFPTFCCGTAGVSYFLATLSQESSSNAGFLDAAKMGAAHILSLGVRKNNSLLIPHEEEGDGKNVFYMGWCGGPVGWSRLFVKLYQITSNKILLQNIEDAIDTLRVFAEPDLAMFYPSGPVPWRNLGQCCGASGVGTFLLEAANSGTWLPLSDNVKKKAFNASKDVAFKITSHAVATMNGLTFPSPEEHSQPLNTTWQAGWMQGSAGIASYLLHLDSSMNKRNGGMRIFWPDEPWIL